MKELSNNSQHEESTYSLLTRSEEKNRNGLEMVIYPVLIVAGLIAIWQFAQQRIDIPTSGGRPATMVTACGTAQAC